MKRLVLFIALSFALLSEFFAVQTDSIYFATEIPEDFGVVFPDNAIRLDKFVFELPNNALISDPYTTVVTFPGESGSIPIDILYYGNSSEDYVVSLKAATDGWVAGEDTSFSIPVDILFEEYLGEEGIYSNSDKDGQAYIVVPAAGPRNGDKVATMVLSWNLPHDTAPGDYTMNLDMVLESD